MLCDVVDWMEYRTVIMVLCVFFFLLSRRGGDGVGYVAVHYIWREGGG